MLILNISLVNKEVKEGYSSSVICKSWSVQEVHLLSNLILTTFQNLPILNIKSSVKRGVRGAC